MIVLIEPRVSIVKNLCIQLILVYRLCLYMIDFILRLRIRLKMIVRDLCSKAQTAYKE